MHPGSFFLKKLQGCITLIINLLHGYKRFIFQIYIFFIFKYLIYFYIQILKHFITVKKFLYSSIYIYIMKSYYLIMKDDYDYEY